VTNPPFQSLGDRYTIENEIGRGGMATVYRARDPRHGRSVAVKVLNSDVAAAVGVERFLQEIKTVASLTHPHIVPVHDSGESEGVLLYVMPHVQGERLRGRITREKTITSAEVVRITRSLGAALDFAHRNGVVHRDIKPENIILFEGEPLILDFGIAKAVSAAGSETLTQTGMMVGTPAYVSPEQAAGEATIDGRSDQYSLACVLYEMLSGERPFTGATTQAVLAKRFTESVKPLRSIRANIPGFVERAVTRAMTTDAGGRYATASMFAQALASTLNTPSDT